MASFPACTDYVLVSYKYSIEYFFSNHLSHINNNPEAAYKAISGLLQFTSLIALSTMSVARSFFSMRRCES